MQARKQQQPTKIKVLKLRRKHACSPKKKPRVLMRYLLQMTMATDEVTERPSAPATPIREPAPSDISFPSPPTAAAGGFPAGAEADMSERAVTAGDP